MGRCDFVLKPTTCRSGCTLEASSPASQCPLRTDNLQARPRRRPENAAAVISSKRSEGNGVWAKGFAPLEARSALGPLDLAWPSRIPLAPAHRWGEGIEGRSGKAAALRAPWRREQIEPLALVPATLHGRKRPFGDGRVRPQAACRRLHGPGSMPRRLKGLDQICKRYRPPFLALQAAADPPATPAPGVTTAQVSAGGD